MVILTVLVDLCNNFTQNEILHSYFTGNGAINDCPSASEVTINHILVGKIGH